jgi:hypothetical protein
MTKDRVDYFLNKWIQILGLSDWRIRVVYDYGDDHMNLMEIIRSQDYQQAKIIIPPWWFDEKEIPEGIFLMSNIWDENYFEEVLVHELLHIFITPMGVIIRTDLENFLHRDVHSQIVNAFSRAEERSVDNLAVALCKAFRGKGHDKGV